MSWSECGLALKATLEEGKTILHFTQPCWGFSGHLCTIEKYPGEAILEPELPGVPDAITRTVFRWLHGVRNFEPELLVRSSTHPRDAIRFYRCVDSRGRERRFVYATEARSEGGGSMMVRKEDYEEVRKQLCELPMKHLPSV